MRLYIDEYAHLNSPLHRADPRAKFAALLALMLLFSLVRDVALIPVMLSIAALLYAVSRLPVTFLVSRLRYPGLFLLVLVVVLPLFVGQTVLWRMGPLALRAEGLEYMLLLVGRFIAILTLSLILFGTTPVVTTTRTLRTFGIPALLTDMLLLTLRYLFEMAEMLGQMQNAMLLRGFTLTRFTRLGAAHLANLVGTLLVRSYEQSERVFQAMKLRGYALHQDAGPSPAAPTQDVILDVDHLTVAYPRCPPVLQNVALTVHRGERVGIIGPNGAGKTSLFLALTGLIKPSGGTITLCGRPVHAGKFHPEIGLVFQNPADQLFSPTVRDDVAFGPLNLGLDAQATRARVDSALALTATGHLAERAPHHLSGGEKRMVAIAGVWAMEPQLVLYDEPDANLDSRARRRFIDFLRAVPHTCCIASHDLELILEVCDRVVVLDQGRIMADGPPREIMAQAALMKAHGLERPRSLVTEAE